MNIIKLKQDINHKSEERKGIMTVAGGQLEVIGKMAVAGGQAKAKTKRTVVSGGFWWETEAPPKSLAVREN